MGGHINQDGEFQSDKYPSCPAGKVPLSTKDPSAQDLLAEYARRRRVIDAEFSDDLDTCLAAKGWVDPKEMRADIEANIAFARDVVANKTYILAPEVRNLIGTLANRLALMGGFVPRKS